MLFVHITTKDNELKHTHDGIMPYLLELRFTFSPCHEVLMTRCSWVIGEGGRENLVMTAKVLAGSRGLRTL